ncbi:bifunctional diaminohydroxyphosphoribosylaminopyrimidine deaminase/5-amino-6-(5-phosphoribosylamino)uracil reductase RibD [Thalassotalea maritima]|uniref:bifunctional diaminohydroxyphosphoribosylaminopyrimidine deaminase/5-amino-6-(5-phosphoribosylamino)uracil reductase RibD n=1 Tax=Thalassotalea maritima TaxID=3242416 RepID=UPI003527C119
MVNTHEHFMQLAVQLAKHGLYTTSPNPRVGCVLVKDGGIVGQGYHLKAGSGHAEVNAIRDAGDDARGATAYVTLEPCSHYGRTPPCAKGLIDAGITRVVYGMQDPNPLVSGRGIAMLKEAGIECVGPVLEQACRELNPGFIQRMVTGKPLVRCKLAASLDGKTAMASGESKWITGSAARADVQHYRARSCAIISGADTVLTDDARLNVRAEQLYLHGDSDAFKLATEQTVRQPVRVIIDTKQRLSPDLALFSIESPIILVRIAGHNLENSVVWPHFVEQLLVKEKDGQADLCDLVKQLAKRGFNELWLESGRVLSGAFFKAQLVDELVLYQAPKLMADAALGLVDIPELDTLAQAIALEINDIRKIGDDVRFICHVKNDQ